MVMKDDPGLEPVRAARHAISAAFDHDPARLLAYYVEMQRAFAGRLVGAPEATELRAAEGGNPDQPDSRQRA
jgi:hypothetical protein